MASAGSNAGKSTPKEAQIMAAILKDMGVNEYEPRVVNQMMEFSYRKNMLLLTPVIVGVAVLCFVHPMWGGGFTKLTKSSTLVF